MRRRLHLHQALKDIQRHTHGVHIIIQVQRLHLVFSHAMIRTTILQGHRTAMAKAIAQTKIRRRATVERLRSLILVRRRTHRQITNLPNLTVIIKMRKCHNIQANHATRNVLLGRAALMLTMLRLSTNAKNNRAKLPLILMALNSIDNSIAQLTPHLTIIL